MDGDQGKVVLGEDGSVERKDSAGPCEVKTHEEREDGSDCDGDECEGEVLKADDAVVGGEEIVVQGRAQVGDDRGGGLRLQAVTRVEQGRLTLSGL